jgi:hypothetical protein
MKVLLNFLSALRWRRCQRRAWRELAELPAAAEARSVPVREPELEPTGKRFRLGRPFSAPEPRLFGLQTRAAASLLGAVGAPCLPPQLVALLRHRSAPEAVELFLGALGLDYAGVLRSGARRERLARAVRVLAEAGAVTHDAGLGDLPLFRALSAPDETRADECLQRLGRIAPIAKRLHQDGIVFAQYHSQFYDELLPLLADWDAIDDETLAGIAETHGVWRELQRRYEALLEEIDPLVATLHAALGPEGALRETLERMAATLAALRAGLEDEGLEPAAGLEGLAELCAELRMLADAAGTEGAGGRSHRTSARGGASAEEALSRCLEALGLAGAGDLDQETLKKAYRKLALLHHPDRGGDTETFMQVDEAYRTLLQRLEERREAA